MNDVTRRPLRIVLAGINSQYVHSALAPWCLLSGLERYAHCAYEAQVMEGTVNEPPQAVAARLAQSQPDLVGIGAYIWNIIYLQRLLPALRSLLPQALIVLGGPEATHDAGRILRACPQVDVILAGEGEWPFACLADAVANAQGPDQVPGACYWQEGKAVLSPPYQPPVFEPLTYSPQYFAQLAGRIAYLEGSRGCPFHCAFCLSGREERVRLAPLPAVKEALLRLAASGSKTIKLVDRTFNAHLPRAKQILRFLAQQAQAGTIPAAVTFHFEIAGDLVDEEMVQIVAASPAALFQFEIGIQSFCTKTLEEIQRKTDLDKASWAVRSLVQTGRAHIHIDLIAGLPLEGLQGFADGFQTAFVLGAHALQLGILKVIPGSALRGRAQHYGLQYAPDAPYAVQQTPWLSREDMRLVLDAQYAMDQTYNKGRLWQTLDYLVPQKQQSAFDWMAAVGARLHSHPGPVTPQTIAQTVLDCAQERLPGEQARLRDLLACDHLAATPLAPMPDCLRIADSRFARIPAALEKMAGAAGPKQKQRPFAILYTSGGPQVVWADSAGRDPVSGRYPLHTLPLKQLLR